MRAPMGGREDSIAIAAIFRDQADYLAEWICFHELVGARHIYLYDNNSHDDPSRVLSPFLARGLVSLIPWHIPFHEQAAARAYSDALERSRGVHRWLACLDLDEFLFAPASSTLEEALWQRRQHPGIVVRWQCYGSSGHEKSSARPVIERFQYRAPSNWIRNRRVKSIVDPQRTLPPSGCHHFHYADGALAVTESGREVWELPKRRWLKQLRPWLGKVPTPLLRRIDPYAIGTLSCNRIEVNHLRINHYPIRSREEFMRKASFMQEKGRYKGINYFDYHDRNEIHDPILLRYLPELKRRLGPLQ